MGRMRYFFFGRLAPETESPSRSVDRPTFAADFKGLPPAKTFIPVSAETLFLWLCERPVIKRSPIEASV